MPTWRLVWPLLRLLQRRDPLAKAGRRSRMSRPYPRRPATPAGTSRAGAPPAGCPSASWTRNTRTRRGAWALKWWRRFPPTRSGAPAWGGLIHPHPGSTVAQQQAAALPRRSTARSVGGRNQLLAALAKLLGLPFDGYGATAGPAARCCGDCCVNSGFRGQSR
jgi:hypothetical protein